MSEPRIQGPPDRHGMLRGTTGIYVFSWPNIACGLCDRPVKTPQVSDSIHGVIHKRCSRRHPLFDSSS